MTEPTELMPMWERRLHAVATGGPAYVADVADAIAALDRLRAWQCPDCGLTSGSAATLVAKVADLERQLAEAEEELARLRKVRDAAKAVALDSALSMIGDAEYQVVSVASVDMLEKALAACERKEGG